MCDTPFRAENEGATGPFTGVQRDSLGTPLQILEDVMRQSAARQDCCSRCRSMTSGQDLDIYFRPFCVGFRERGKGEAFLLAVGVFCLQLSFFAYSLLRCLLDALSYCKQKTCK